MTTLVPDTDLTRLGEPFIRRRIRLLRRIDLSKARIDTLTARLVDLLRAYVTIPLKITGEESIFRARKHREDEREVYLENVRGIYPQSQFITHLGRANREQQPIYYFAADKGIALNEVKPAPGDIVTILECKPVGNASPNLIPIGIHQMAEKHGARIGVGSTKITIEDLFDNDAASILKHKMIDDFISEEFLRVVEDSKEHLYKLTIAIAELLFNFETPVGPIDGLAYPSLASNRINANVAFLPDSFHRIYRPASCTRLKIEEPLTKVEKGIQFHGFAVSGEHMAKSVRDDGDIEW